MSSVTKQSKNYVIELLNCKKKLCIIISCCLAIVKREISHLVDLGIGSGQHLDGRSNWELQVLLDCL